MGDFFQHTLFYLVVTPPKRPFPIIGWAIFNTAVRLGAVYGGIRVVMTALDHGPLL